MKKKVIIDYLNFISFFYLVKNERNSDVISLFKAKATFFESILIKLLTLFRISYSHEAMLFANLSTNPVKGVIESNAKLTKLISKPFYLPSSSQINNFYNFYIDSWVFHNLWRATSINEYVNIYYKDINKIYISSPIKKKLLERFFKIDTKFNVHLYSSVGLINESKYAYRKTQLRFNALGVFISRFVYILNLIFYVSVVVKIPRKKINVLVFTHDREERKWLGINDLPAYINCSSEIVLPNQTIGENVNQLKVNMIQWWQLGNFYAHMFAGLFKFSWALKLNFVFYTDLLKSWKYVFLLDNIYEELDVKIVISGGYESELARVAIAIASDKKDMISLDSTASLGEYPLEFSGSWHKFSDRFFLWGSWHYDLARACNDMSLGYIISGYIFDDRISIMQQKAVTFKNQYSDKYDNIITIFDTTIDNDHSFSGDIVLKLIELVIKIAKDFNALVVLKTKKGNSEYENFLKLYSEDEILVHYEKGSLVSALASDVIVGLSACTPAAIASGYKKNMVMFDPNKIVWTDFVKNSDLNPLIHSFDDLDKRIRVLLSSNTYQKNFQNDRFDPFADGKSQLRIAQYINCLFNNLHLGKEEAIKCADSDYISEWGKDKVIIKNF